MTAQPPSRLVEMPARPGRRHAWACRGVLDAARALAARRLVVGSVGNVSMRVDGGIAITPTSMDYAAMTESDIVVVRDGSSGADAHLASRELPMHLAIYAARADAHAIVHTHSVHATAWSFLDEPLLPRLEESEYYDIGPVATSAPARAGSSELADRAVAALGSSRAALLGRHGVVAVGATPAAALTIAEVVERQAHVAWLLRPTAR